MGTPEGRPIPISPNSNEYLKDNQGNVVVTTINEQMLKEIAASGKGMYVRASNSSAGLDVLYNEINKMNKTDIESKIYTDYDEKFQIFVAIAILLLILELIVIERRNKLLKRIRIFDIKTKS